MKWAFTCFPFTVSLIGIVFCDALAEAVFSVAAVLVSWAVLLPVPVDATDPQAAKERQQSSPASPAKHRFSA